MKAWQLIDSPEKWTQKSFARTDGGSDVSVFSSYAVCFCAYGALTRCYPGESDYQNAVAKLRKAVPHGYVAGWNDAKGRTWQEVHAVLKELDI